MATTSSRPAMLEPVCDHRIEVAARKRAQMRARLIEAMSETFWNASRPPAIDDVARAARVSRGTFYLHFASLDEAARALAKAQSDGMTEVAFSLYDLLKEPWQRFAVGFRLFLRRAHLDPKWASLMTGVPGTSEEWLMTGLMRNDLRRGKEAGQFVFGDLDVAVNVTLSISMAGIRVLGLGVPNPERYVDDTLSMALSALQCSSALHHQGLKFSRTYLAGWRIRHAGDDGPCFEEVLTKP